MAVLVSIVVIALLAALGGGLWWWRRHTLSGQRSAQHHSSEPPIVVLPAQRPTLSAAALRAERAEREATASDADRRARTFAPPPGSVPPADADAGDPPLALTSLEREIVPGLADMPRPASGGVRRLRPDGERPIRPHPGMTAVALAAADPAPIQTGTLRMLPGRLEVLAGLPTRSEIRFVQTGASAEQQVTVGRQEGRPYEHVQLASMTVSRMHATLRFQRGRWLVANLSETNPVRLNGAALDREARPLADGDVLELGEVVLRFRA